MSSKILVNNAIHRPKTGFLREEQNFRRKRPVTTKLDLEKIFIQSIQLKTEHTKLLEENQRLKKNYHKAEQRKNSRQNLIFAVENLVRKKAAQFQSQQDNHKSWFRLKLMNKAYELKNKIEQKQNQIKQMVLSPQIQAIREKQSKLRCLQEIVDHLEVEDKTIIKPKCNIQTIKCIISLEQELSNQQQNIQRVQQAYQKEEKSVHQLQQRLQKSKQQLNAKRKIKVQYFEVQKTHQKQKINNQTKTVQNKQYIEDLKFKKKEQQNKIKQLVNKFEFIKKEQEQNIHQLQQKLKNLKQKYSIKLAQQTQISTKVTELAEIHSQRKWVHRVTYQEIKYILDNQKYQLALRRISSSQIVSSLNTLNKQSYQIEQVMNLLSKDPFCIQNKSFCLLIARYSVENTGQGLLLQQMSDTQNSIIIRSVLCKLFGEILFCSMNRIDEILIKIASIMIQFYGLIRYNIDPNSAKNDMRLYTSKDRLQQILNTIAPDDIDIEEIEIVMMYLYSWSKDCLKLQVNLLTKIRQKGINWTNK